MHSFGGAPWNYQRWKEITNVHNGLFPDEDKDLPDGWTRKHAEEIAYFFDLFNTKSGLDAIKFVSARKDPNLVPGRADFQRWLTAVWRTGQIHAKITDTLLAHSLHPVTIALGAGQRSLKKWWPSPRQYVGRAVDIIAVELFGEEALDLMGLLESDLRAPSQALIVRTWSNIKAQVKRAMLDIENHEEEVTNAFESMPLIFTPEDSLK